MSTKPKSRTDSAQETTDRLIAVARASFAERGFAGVSLDALAADAGLTRGALHHHFGNKAGLFEAVLRRIDAEVAAEMDRVWAAEPDPWLGFRACFHAYLDTALHPDRCRILFQDAPAVLGIRSVDILMESGLGETVADIQALIAEGRIRGPDAEALGHLLHGAIITLAFWAAEGAPSDNRRTRAHAALSALFDGLVLSA
jgi:AcrR family transcriptional regulator